MDGLPNRGWILASLDPVGEPAGVAMALGLALVIDSSTASDASSSEDEYELPTEPRRRAPKPADGGKEAEGGKDAADDKDAAAPDANPDHQPRARSGRRGSVVQFAGRRAAVSQGAELQQLAERLRRALQSHDANEMQAALTAAAPAGASSSPPRRPGSTRP